ncbi:hypothetical protein ABZ942_15520 [Nocardia sp. NPDC046473]
MTRAVFRIAVAVSLLWALLTAPGLVLSVVLAELLVVWQLRRRGVWR